MQQNGEGAGVGSQNDLEYIGVSVSSTLFWGGEAGVLHQRTISEIPRESVLVTSLAPFFLQKHSGQTPSPEFRPHRWKGGGESYSWR